MPTIALAEDGTPIRLEDGRYLLLSTPTPLREAAIAAIAAQLAASLPSWPIERNRRAPVDVERETLPRIVMREGSHQPQGSDAFGLTLYRVEVPIEFWVVAASDALLGPALNEAHAAMVTAVCNREIVVDGNAQSISPEELAFDAESIPARDSKIRCMSGELRIGFNLRWSDTTGPYATT